MADSPATVRDSLSVPVNCVWQNGSPGAQCAARSLSRRLPRRQPAEGRAPRRPSSHRGSPAIGKPPSRGRRSASKPEPRCVGAPSRAVAAFLPHVSPFPAQDHPLLSSPGAPAPLPPSPGTFPFLRERPAPAWPPLSPDRLRPGRAEGSAPPAGRAGQRRDSRVRECVESAFTRRPGAASALRGSPGPSGVLGHPRRSEPAHRASVVDPAPLSSPGGSPWTPLSRRLQRPPGSPSPPAARFPPAPRRAAPPAPLRESGSARAPTPLTAPAPSGTPAPQPGARSPQGTRFPRASAPLTAPAPLRKPGSPRALAPLRESSSRPVRPLSSGSPALPGARSPHGT